MTVYATSGLAAGLAGVLVASRLNAGYPRAGEYYELDAIAAVVVGGTSLQGGVGSAAGTLVGALIMSVLRNGLNLLGVSAYVQQVAIGVVIVAAVLLDTTLRGRSRTALEPAR
jgi:ribose transport system permease protein